jgi:ribonuclease HI
VGVGGYLVLSQSLIDAPSSPITISKLKDTLALKRFEGTSSTKLEVQTVLWALEQYCLVSSISSVSDKLHIYTDSQCVEGLLLRRTRLESSGFRSKGGNRPLKNAALYRKYYEFHDRLKFQVTKVAGHTPARSRDTAQHVFSFIDRNVRLALKSWINQLDAERAKR